MKYVVIGGNAAGMSFAMKLKRNQDCEITVLEKGSYVSFGACGLPYFVANEFESENNMFSKSIEDIQKTGIDLIINAEVINVRRNSKSLIYKKDLQDVEIFYDILVVASGAKPIIYDFKTEDSHSIHTLTNLNDGIVLKEKLNNPKYHNITIVGGGFIGLEMLDTCVHLNKNVTLIEREKTIMGNVFSPVISKYVEDEILLNNVDLLLETSVLEIKNVESHYSVVTSLKTIEADLVILCLGFNPNTDFIDIPKFKNAIIVDKFSKTEDDFIYAIGDCSMIYNQVTDEMVYLPLATSANKQGRFLADYLSLKKTSFKGMLGSSCLLVLGYELAATGINEMTAKKMNLDYKTAFLVDKNHTNYYKNQTDIMFKIVYDANTHVIYGCEGVGKNGVVSRINTMALAIYSCVTTEELGYIDFAYAPPFSRTWDALNVLGNISK